MMLLNFSPYNYHQLAPKLIALRLAFIIISTLISLISNVNMLPISKYEERSFIIRYTKISTLFDVFEANLPMLFGLRAFHNERFYLWGISFRKINCIIFCMKELFWPRVHTLSYEQGKKSCVFLLILMKNTNKHLGKTF